MSYYTSQIPLHLAEKLKEKGMPIEMQPLYAPEAPNARGIVKAGVGLWCPSYAEVFDWFLDKEVFVNAYPERISAAYGEYIYMYRPFVNGYIGKESDRTTWHDAANRAIEKALELIKEE